jgi:thymidylate synthase
VRLIEARNVNDAFYTGMNLLSIHGVREDSRAGKVKVAPWPVTTIYRKPMERVLFDHKRDANPFFHLMEGLWMLAGRYDSDFLNRYVGNFGERFAEKDGTIHDAYGQRWRMALGYDQLDEIVKKLQSNPRDRQCVLQMWDGTDKPDALAGWRGYNDLRGDWRGRPCNTHAYFRIRGPLANPGDIDSPSWDIDHPSWYELDMTISCRSNDAIWGAHGANVVHFSMLLEYMAGRIGCRVGVMYQHSNNYHAYVEEMERIGDVTGNNDPYFYDYEIEPMPMGEYWDDWDEDLRRFMNWHDDEDSVSKGYAPIFINKWFLDVAIPVALARWQWTHGQKLSARKTAEWIVAPDWRRACVEWMERRKK